MLRTKVVEKIGTHILCPVSFFFFFNRAVCEIMWINVLEWDRPQMTIWHMSIACWIPRATNKHLGWGAFPLQQCGCTNTPQCCVIHTFPLWFVSVYFHCKGLYSLSSEDCGFYASKTVNLTWNTFGIWIAAVWPKHIYDMKVTVLLISQKKKIFWNELWKRIIFSDLIL